MGENLQGIPPEIRKKPAAPPLPPEGVDRVGTDLGTFAPFLRGSGSMRSLIERPNATRSTTRSGHNTPASTAAPEVKKHTLR